MKPYPFQEQVAKLLLEGKSVVLQAPTGSGKTKAALLPFLHAWHSSKSLTFPTKCIYTVPMRVLAHQFVNEVKGEMSSYERRYRRALNVRIQTGDQPDDPRLEGDLIFCTIDQFLSSYLCMPYSLNSRMANLNAGAAVGAYIVFDEFHLLDPDSSLPSALYALKQLCRVAPVLIMTATFSATMLSKLAQELGAEVVLIPADEAHYIETRGETLPARRRTWRTADAPLSAANVLALHRSRSLVLCNTVARAKDLFRELQGSIQENNLDIRLLLLHSRFLPEDRQRIEEDLHRLFGKEADHSGSAILVATQTIEVGVDISSEVLHTELAPASALIQRAGRCARYPGEQGQVIVYPVETYAPYSKANAGESAKAAWAVEMQAAFDWLKAHDGQVFDFAVEQELVNAVATRRDEQVLFGLAAGEARRTESILRVLTGDRTGDEQRLLVRDIDSKLVLIHPEPNNLLENPYRAQGFSLPTSTLFGMVKDWLERDADVEWRVKQLIEDPQPDSTESNRSQYAWKEFTNLRLLPAARVLVVHPALAGYSKTEGFLHDKGDTGFISTLSELSANAQAWERHAYHLESYEDHIRRVLEAFQEIALPELLYPSRALERAAGWPEGSVLRAAWLACLLHDTGKLSQGWQGWARAYQKEIGSPVPARFAVAHTDNQPGNPVHKAAEKAVKGRHPKPHHAGEGALAVGLILKEALGVKELLQAAVTAITRHHTPFANTCETYALDPYAEGHIRETLQWLPEDLRQSVRAELVRKEVKVPPTGFSGVLSNPGEVYGWMVYLLLARALRRSDQEGTAQRSKEV